MQFIFVNFEDQHKGTCRVAVRDAFKCKLRAFFHFAGERHLEFQRRVRGSGVVALVFHRQQDGLRFYGWLQLDHLSLQRRHLAALHHHEVVRAIGSRERCLETSPQRFGRMSLVVLLFTGSAFLRNFVGVLNSETLRRRGVALGYSQQLIVEALIAAMEILVLLLHIVQGSLLGGGASAPVP